MKNNKLLTNPLNEVVILNNKTLETMIVVAIGLILLTLPFFLILERLS